MFDGGQLSHFQRKVANQVAKLTAMAAEPNKDSESNTPLKEVTNKELRVIKTCKTGHQKKTEITVALVLKYSCLGRDCFCGSVARDSAVEQDGSNLT